MGAGLNPSSRTIAHAGQMKLGPGINMKGCAGVEDERRRFNLAEQLTQAPASCLLRRMPEGS